MWELRYYAFGVVALAWGSVLRPRGVLLLFPLPQTRGYWAMSWGWKDEHLDGWGPAEATEVTTIENLGFQLKGMG
ncbi:hypothetical protein CesoFtcFv8_017415 [Champsocephalus esox]|uniref:Uncharacterized protein n=1 Tax=Champsocephalus esox TaxID=159716 RepID=A0AAN8BK97_9TELE|nr:hypothetical protein CesoFtcFv8_017415 [Champsocephalus esox]